MEMGDEPITHFIWKYSRSYHPNNSNTTTNIFTSKIFVTAKKQRRLNTAKPKKLADRLCQEQRRHKFGITGNNPVNSKHNAKVKRTRKTLQCAIKYNTDPMKNVINLSNKSFTFYEFKLPNKELNLYPTPNRYNKTRF